MIPDLREVLKSLTGEQNKFIPSKQIIGFQWLGLRKTDYSKKCSCWNKATKDAPPGCKRCMLSGYLFTDFLVKGYVWMGVLGAEFGTPPGILSTQQKNVVIKYDKILNKFDYILELAQDINTGRVSQPFNILKYNRVQDALPIKGDSGRVEFWKGIIEERQIESGRLSDVGNISDFKSNGRINDS